MIDNVFVIEYNTHKMIDMSKVVTTNANDAREYISTVQAAEILGYSSQHVARLFNWGLLKGIRPMRDILLDPESVESFRVQYPHGRPRGRHPRTGTMISKRRRVASDGAQSRKRRRTEVATPVERDSDQP